MHFLLIRFSSLGDIVLSTSFANWLKFVIPDAKIDFVTLKGNEVLINKLPCFAKVYTHEKKKGLNDIKGLISLSKTLKKNNYDIVFDLHNTMRSKIMRILLFKLPSLIVDKWGLERWALVKFKKDFLSKKRANYEQAIVDFSKIINQKYDKELFLKHQKNDGHNSLTLSNAAFKKERPLSKSENKNNSGRSIFTSITVCPGASFETKKYPVKLFADVLKKVLVRRPEIHLNIIGAPYESECDVLASELSAFSKRVFNLRGLLTLEECAEKISSTKLVLGNDSLFGHIADSCNVTAISIFGPTDERFGFAPYGDHSMTFSLSNLQCRPCSTTGSKPCFLNQKLCMENIDRDKLVHEILKRV